MKLERSQLQNHRPEISHLYQKFLGEEAKGMTFFAAFSESGELMGVASLKNYSGHWYLRGCVVKPNFQHQGVHKRLTQERIGELQSRGIETVRVSIFPENERSISNMLAAGFVFEKEKPLKDGSIVNVYKKDL